MSEDVVGDRVRRSTTATAIVQDLPVMPFKTRTTLSIAIKTGILTIGKTTQGTASAQASIMVPRQSFILKRTLQTRQPLDEISFNVEQRQQPQDCPSKRQRLNHARMPPLSLFLHPTPSNEPNLSGITVNPVQQSPSRIIQSSLGTTTSQSPPYCRIAII